MDGEGVYMLYIYLIHFAEYAVGSLPRFCPETIWKVVLKIVAFWCAI